MKRFGREYRLQADSDLSVTREFDHAMADVGDLRFGGRKVRPGAMINALCLWFSTLPLHERRRFSAEIVRNLEAYMENDGEGGGGAEPVGIPPSESSVVGLPHNPATGEPLRRPGRGGKRTG